MNTQSTQATMNSPFERCKNCNLRLIEGEQHICGSTMVNEQAKPTNSNQDDCWLLVMKDMLDRRQLGMKKYGQPVMANNGRKPLIDAYQELLDLIVYLRQEIEEKEKLTQSADVQTVMEEIKKKVEQEIKDERDRIYFAAVAIFDINILDLELRKSILLEMKKRIYETE